MNLNANYLRLFNFKKAIICLKVEKNRFEDEW